VRRLCVDGCLAQRAGRTRTVIMVSAIISPSRTDTKSIISPAPKLSPKTLKDTEMTTANPNPKP